MSAPAHSLSDLPAGTMVGAYRIDRRLGAGGMGAVYAGVEPTIGKKVAIKVLKHAFAEDTAAVERFKREAQAANDVGHPGIVDVFAIGTLADGRPYLVMSLLEGRSLRDEIAARTKIGAVEAWGIVREVAEALSAAHGRGIVHRDLKPDNVFLERVPNRPPRVRLLDFGLAKMTEAKGSDLEKLTGTGMLMGTPAYMAPEQWWAAGIDAATDQYALGAMLFEMLTGAPPFRGSVYAALLQAHLHEKPPTLAASGSDAGAPVEALVAKMLAKAGTDRYPTIDDAIRAGDAAFGVAAPAAHTPAPAAIAKTEISHAETLASAPVVPTPLDPGFGRASLRRFLGLFAAILVVGAAGVVAVGYTGDGRHSPAYWSHIGGWGANATTIASSLAALVVFFSAWRRARRDGRTRLAWGLSLFATFSGLLGTYTGWLHILEGLARANPSDRYRFFSIGMFEANACRFIGLSCGMLLFLGIAALEGLSGAKPSRAAAAGLLRKESLAAIATLVLVGGLAALAAAPSGALVAGAAAVAVGVALLVPASHPERAAEDELWRMVAAALAVLLAVGAGFARIEAREGFLWEREYTRAERAREILAAVGERRATLIIALACVAIVVGVEVLRVLRLRRAGVSLRPTVGRAVTLVGLALLVFGDAFAMSRMDAARVEYREAVAAQFSLVGRLEPPILPSGSGIEAKHAPLAAPSLQISEDAVVVEGDVVTRLAAAPASRDPRVSRALNRALTQAVSREGSSEAPDLSVTVDQNVRWGDVAHLLALAKDEGVRRVDFLLVKTRAPRLDPGAPPEAQVIVPEDFAAFRVHFEGDPDLRPLPEEEFGAVVRQLLRHPAPVRIAVEP